MVGRFNEEELDLLAREAQEELLAGLGHRFSESHDVALDSSGRPFISQILAATVLRAALVELEEELRRILANASRRRRRERVFGSDPLSGTLDLGRIALARPEIDQWPLTRVRRTHDTPENAVISAALAATQRWGAGNAQRFPGWLGVKLFSDSARSANAMRSEMRRALGALHMEDWGSGQLLPLARERLALRQADPALYARALELVEILLLMVDPRREASRSPQAGFLVQAMLGGLNEAGLQHVAFELWVASRVIKTCRDDGFELRYPHQRGSALAVGKKGPETVEVWWQSPKAIIGWPSNQEHEKQTQSGAWEPLSLMPDLVIVRRNGSSRQLAAIECKNKARDATDSKDLAQAFGYLSHYDALPSCGLVYRAMPDQRRFRRVPTGQVVVAMQAPVEPADSVGEALLKLAAI